MRRRSSTSRRRPTRSPRDRHRSRGVDPYLCMLAYGTSAPIGRITSFSAKFTDAPLAEGKFETYLHERKNAKSRAP
jgi:hypothetical protein